jgi:hypothetical protein
MHKFEQPEMGESDIAQIEKAKYAETLVGWVARAGRAGQLMIFMRRCF